MRQETEKKTYTVKEVAEMLAIGKNKAYDFIKNNPPFKVIDVAGTYRIHKQSFDKWIEQVEVK